MKNIKLKNAIKKIIEDYENEGLNKAKDSYWTEEGVAPSFVAKHKDNKDISKIISLVKPEYNVGKEILRVTALVKYKFSTIDNIAINRKTEEMLLEALGEVKTEFNDLFEDPDGYGVGTLRDISNKISAVFNYLSYSIEVNEPSIILYTTEEKDTNLYMLRLAVYSYFIFSIDFTMKYSDLIIEVYFGKYKQVAKIFEELNIRYDLFCSEREDENDIIEIFFNRVELAIEYARSLNNVISDKSFLLRMKYSPEFESHSALRKLLKFEESKNSSSIFTTKLCMYLSLASLDDDIGDVSKYASFGIDRTDVNYLKRDLLLFLGIATDEEKLILDAIEIEKKVVLKDIYENKQNKVHINQNYAKQRMIMRLIHNNLECRNLEIFSYILEMHYTNGDFSIDSVTNRINSLDPQTCYLEYFSAHKFNNNTYSFSPYDESEYRLILVTFIGGDVSSLKIKLLNDNRDNYLRKISYFRSLVTKLIKPEWRYIALAPNMETQQIKSKGPVSEISDHDVTRWANKLKNLFISSYISLDNLSLLGVDSLKIFSNFDINRIPFEIFPLHDNEDSCTFLGERFECSYGVASSMVKQTYGSKTYNKPINTKPVVIANPNFNAKLIREEKVLIKEMFNYFPKIDESKKEGEIVSQLINAESLFDDSITKENIVKLNSPHILHISTHSFWQDVNFYHQMTISTRLEETICLFKQKKQSYNHGLALAGCNLNLEIEKDGAIFNKHGFLTIDEIKNLNLKDTSLVFLSSCESGLGEVNSDNYFESIASAFLIAGAKSVVGSLWKIPDTTAKEFVSIFYENFKDGLTVSKSMQKTKYIMNKKKYEQEDWASYILYGSTETKYEG